MSLAVTAQTLQTLHRMHRQLADLHERQAVGPRQVLARSAQLKAAEVALATIQGSVKQSKMAADQKQLQLRSSEAKIIDYETKLNASKTNREYQTLRDQIAADKMATSVLQDEILEALERIDTFKCGVSEAEAVVTKSKSLLVQVKTGVDQEEHTLHSEVARIVSAIGEVEQDLPNDSRETYQRTVKSKGADAMAAVESDSCGGCFQKLTGNTLAELTMARVVVCRNCGRLLYMPDSRLPKRVEADSISQKSGH